MQNMSSKYNCNSHYNYFMEVNLTSCICGRYCLSFMTMVCHLMVVRHLSSWQNLMNNVELLFVGKKLVYPRVLPTFCESWDKKVGGLCGPVGIDPRHLAFLIALYLLTSTCVSALAADQSSFACGEAIRLACRKSVVLLSVSMGRNCSYRHRGLPPP